MTENVSRLAHSHAFGTHEAVQGEIKRLRDTVRLSWPAIAAEPCFSPIPFGTLREIYETGTVPRKWWGRLGVGAKHPRPRLTIHKENMRSAYRSIIDNLPPEKVEELTRLLLVGDDGPNPYHLTGTELERTEAKRRAGY